MVQMNAAQLNLDDTPGSQDRVLRGNCRRLGHPKSLQLPGFVIEMITELRQ